MQKSTISIMFAPCLILKRRRVSSIPKQTKLLSQASETTFAFVSFGGEVDGNEWWTVYDDLAKKG